MTKYSITRNGNLSVVDGKSIMLVMDYARRTYGQYEPMTVKLASEEDVAWFEAMGGEVRKVSELNDESEVGLMKFREGYK